MKCRRFNYVERKIALKYFGCGDDFCRDKMTSCLTGHNMLCWGGLKASKIW